MAKISPVSIKYMIYASFKSQGPVEKPDVIGAIFGQTEGLLGSDLEMRELQKEGRIGRIEVELQIVDGKSVGEIQVPTALDKSETTIIAATLETIDRIGPTEAEIKINKIEDVRGSKRDYIIERAKKLLAGLDESSKEMGMVKTIQEESRAERIQEYGESELPCGDISGPDLIVVEGRADVVNLLKNRINNVIGMSGARFPKEISELGDEKELTLFVDGDRGGQLIAHNVIENANVKFVAVAPDGKEVEELTGKEILQSLRRKVPVDEYLRRNGKSMSAKEIQKEDEPEMEGDIKKFLKDKYSQIEGTKRAVPLDLSGEEIKNVTMGDFSVSLKKTRKKIFAIAIDGPATVAVIKACEEAGVKHLAAKNFSYVENARVNLVSV